MIHKKNNTDNGTIQVTFAGKYNCFEQTDYRTLFCDSPVLIIRGSAIGEIREAMRTHREELGLN